MTTEKSIIEPVDFVAYAAGDLPEALKGSHSALICGNSGIGAPAAVDLLEQLVATGIKRIISFGTAGALHDGIRGGDLVLCSNAFPDEGTSVVQLPAAPGNRSLILLESLTG